jgi:hypothetical protein
MRTFAAAQHFGIVTELAKWIFPTQQDFAER